MYKLEHLKQFWHHNQKDQDHRGKHAKEDDQVIEDDQADKAYKDEKDHKD